MGIIRGTTIRCIRIGELGREEGRKEGRKVGRKEVRKVEGSATCPCLDSIFEDGRSDYRKNALRR